MAEASASATAQVTHVTMEETAAQAVEETYKLSFKHAGQTHESSLRFLEKLASTNALL